jgi:regulator of protease activity HflC (stomatin/prohibitin superfamily)
MLAALPIEPWTIILIVVLVLALIIFFKTIRIVPQKQAFIIERLGKYSTTLEAGFHILTPFIDKVAYKHTLKEQAVDVQPQACITMDNIAVEVDGILYMQVVDPKKASYGINNYQFASAQLAQTTMRSVRGTRSRTSCRLRASKTRWKSRCAPSGKSGRLSPNPKATARRRSTVPRATGRK